MNDDDNLPDIERIEPPGEASITLTEDDAEPVDQDDAEPSRQEPPREPKTGKWTKNKTEWKRGSKQARAELERERQEKTALQQRLENMERSSQTQQQMFTALIQRMGMPQTPRPAQPTADDHALDAIEAKMDQELTQIASDPKRSQAEYRKMERERFRIIARMEAGQQLRQQPRQEAQTPNGVPQQYAYRNELMKSEFPWLETNQEATVAAQAYRRYLLATGKPDTIETDKLACAHVAAERGLGGGSRPSQRTRMATSGIPGAGRAPVPNGAPRAVSLPAAVLKGTGLSKQRLAQLALGGDDE